MSIILDFLGEKAPVPIPKSLEELRSLICQEFSFSPSDAAEVVVSYCKDIQSKLIKTEEDFVNFLKDKISTLNLSISTESEIYKKSLDIEKKNIEEKKQILMNLKKEKDANKVEIHKMKKKKQEIKKQILKLREERKKTKTKIAEIEKEIYGEKGAEKKVKKFNAKRFFKKVMKKAFTLTKPWIGLKDKNSQENKDKIVYNEEGILKGLTEQMEKVKEILYGGKKEDSKEQLKKENKEEIQMDAYLNGKPFNDLDNFPHILENHLEACSKHVQKEPEKHSPFDRLKTMTKKNCEFIKSISQVNSNNFLELSNSARSTEIDTIPENKQKLEEIKALIQKFSQEMSTFEQSLSSLVNEKCEIYESNLYEIKKKIREFKHPQESTEENGQKKESKKDEKLVVHRNYTCDGCGVHPIVGVRYKCAVCNDFDYCEKCEEKNAMTHQHPFIKINKPELAPKAIKIIVNEKCPDYQNSKLPNK